jgi:chromosome segregation ATPase
MHEMTDEEEIALRSKCEDTAYHSEVVGKCDHECICMTKKTVISLLDERKRAATAVVDCCEAVARVDVLEAEMRKTKAEVEHLKKEIEEYVDQAGDYAHDNGELTIRVEKAEADLAAAIKRAEEAAGTIANLTKQLAIQDTALREARADYAAAHREHRATISRLSDVCAERDTVRGLMVHMDRDLNKMRDALSKAEADLAVERECRVANASELHRADKIIGELRAEVNKAEANFRLTYEKLLATEAQLRGGNVASEYINRCYAAEAKAEKNARACAEMRRIIEEAKPSDMIQFSECTGPFCISFDDRSRVRDLDVGSDYVSLDSDLIKKMEEALRSAQPSHQGGHSTTGRLIREALQALEKERER